MTQETKTALELYAQYKRSKGEVDQTEENTRSLKSEWGNDLRSQLIHQDVKNWLEVGQELDRYCKGNLALKRELEEEVRKIDAKITAQTGRFDKENKAKLDRLQVTIRTAKAKHSRWDTAETIVNIASWLLAIGWVVFFFAVMSADPSGKLGLLRQLFNSDAMLIILILPALLCKGMGIGVCKILSHFATPFACLAYDAKQEIEAVGKEKAALIATIEKEKEDYLELIKRI